MMRFCFWMSKTSDCPETLKEKLGTMSVSVIAVTCADEVIQIGLQTSQVILIFDNVKAGHDYLKENKFLGFRYESYVLVKKIPFLNDQNLRSLAKVNLKVYDHLSEDKLHASIIRFLEVKSGDEFEDLEFLIHNDLKKGA